MLNLDSGDRRSASRRGGFDPFGNAWFGGSNGTLVELDTGQPPGESANFIRPDPWNRTPICIPSSPTRTAKFGAWRVARAGVSAILSENGPLDGIRDARALFPFARRLSNT